MSEREGTMLIATLKDTKRYSHQYIIIKYDISDRMLGTIPKTFSNDTLDLSSVDSISLDEHIEIKIPEARVRENRLMAQNNFVQHINEKLKNINHNHLAVENGQELPKNNSMTGISAEAKLLENNVAARDGHMHRSHSHASMKRAHHGLTPNGVGVNGHHEHNHHRIKK